MDPVLSTFRLAGRRLRRHAGVSATVVCTLGLAIASATTVFSYVNALLLRPFPFRDPEQLVEIRTVSGGESGKLSMREVRDLEERVPIIEAIAAHTGSAGGYNFSGQTKPMEWKAILTTGNLFEVLGVPLALGRRWIPAADRERDFRVILTYDIWQSVFGGRRDVVGQTITLDHAPGYEIAGVAAPGLDFPRGVEVFRSIGGFTNYEARRGRNVVAIARLRRGHTVAEFQSQLDNVAKLLAKEFPDTNRGIEFRATSFRSVYSGEVRPYLLVLFGSVLLLMTIATVNTANLLFARAVANSRELNIRLALGESRTALLTQLAAESALLAALSTGAGWALGYGAIRWLRELIGAQLPSWVSVSPDGRVLAFTGAVAIVASAFCALAPAWQISRLRDYAVALRAGGRGISGDRTERRLRLAFITAQVALAVVLVCGAGLLVRVFGELQSNDYGFRYEDLSTYRVALGWRRYGSRQQIIQYYERAQRDLQASPGIQAVGFGSAPPLVRQEQEENNVIQLDGQSAADAAGNPFPHVQFISENYLTMLRIPLLAGRPFTAFDGLEKEQVAIVSLRLAERLWPGQSPLGKRLALNRTGSATPVFRRIVGVTANVRQTQLAAAPSMDLYIPYRQAGASNQYLLAKTKLGPAAFRQLAEKVGWTIDAEQSLFDFQTYEKRVLDGLWQLRLARALLVVFGAAALFLAATGIFGLMSYVVAQRQREVGIRLALGAQPGQVRQEVLLEGVRVAGTGLLLGSMGAWGAGLVLRTVLSTTRAFDGGVWLGTAVVVLISATAASLLPALRAGRIDPIVALRED